MTSKSVEFTVRTSVLDEETLWRVTDFALERVRKGVTQSIPLSSIQDIRIACDPTSADDARHWCKIRLATGDTLMVVSTHFRGFGDFEDRSATYTPFVRALIAGATRHNPLCTLHAGIYRLRHMMEVTFLAGAVLFLAVVLLLTGMSFWMLLLTGLMLVSATAPALQSYWTKNRPREFTADTVPDDALPQNTRHRQ